MADLDYAAVQALLDKQAISEVLMRYSRAMDRRDWALAKAVYWPDAVDDHINYRGDVDGFLDHAGKFLVDMPTMHFLGNVLVDLESATGAFAETYYLAYHDVPGEACRQDMILWGRYLDSFEKRDGQWRISARTLALDAFSIRPGTLRMEQGHVQGYPHPRRRKAGRSVVSPASARGGGLTVVNVDSC